MAKFRKKPVVIDAVLWDGTEEVGRKLRAWSDHRVRHHGGTSIFIETLEGSMEAKIGDWIIRGVKGEFYPVKDEIFRQTYEAVDDAA